MLEAPANPRISKMEQTSLLTPRPQDADHPYNKHYEEVGPGATKSSLKTKIFLTFFTVVSIATLIALICVIVLRDKEHSNSEPIGNIVPCTFQVPFTNWVNYGLDGTGVTCPTTGATQPCTTNGDCLSISTLCVPGSPHYLSCGAAGVCSVVTESTPQLLEDDGYTMSGYCRRNSTHGVCAMCVTPDCYGAALCAEVKDCSSGKLQCLDAGNFGGSV